MHKICDYYKKIYILKVSFSKNKYMDGKRSILNLELKQIFVYIVLKYTYKYWWTPKMFMSPKN